MVNTVSIRSIKSEIKSNNYMPYTCRECKLVFHSSEGLELHVLRKHTKPIPSGLDHFS